MKYIGSHVSIANGIYNSVDNAVRLGASTFALFLSSPRTWTSKDLKKEDVEKFTELCEKHNFRKDKLLPHGSYLMNLASSDDTLLSKSRALFLKELGKCYQLGLKMYNFHPGSAGKNGDRKQAILRLAESINLANRMNFDVEIVIENMAGQGDILGKDFAELRDIIASVDDKKRIGVCLDTCHLFAAGYDISTTEGLDRVLQEFYDTVGKEYLRAFHVNDSKGPLADKKDRHEDLGEGTIGWTCFDELMKRDDLDELVFITETPGKANVVQSQIVRLRETALRDT